MTVDERTILITGATDGLGLGLAHHLARSGCTLLLHGRDEAKGERVIAEISKATGNDRLEWYQADFADLEQVDAMAEQIRERHTQLHVLVNNAGIGTVVPGGPERQVSKQGHELRFAVNYLAGFALIRWLYPVLNQTGRLDRARIVSVSSAGQQPIDFDDVMLERNYDGGRAYCQSKLAQIMMTMDLAERYTDTKVAATALHPSTFMNTKIVSTPLTTVDDGVQATMRLIDEDDASHINGKYFNVHDEARALDQAYDDEARARLRDLSEELIGM
jgi:NAD(P)-dependent dehydrogenase (short-subunit alcohol dehydrogenase family)